ncbi:MAG: hypothetical protein ACRD96_05360 [Bryobacteraceae bacterium]
MNAPLLTLRISRRAIGAAVLGPESLELADGRHLTSKLDKTTAAAVRFVEYLIGLIKPALLIIDAPMMKPETATARIMDALRSVLSSRQVDVLMLNKPEILAAYGLKSPRNRRELRELVRHYWPELASIRGKVEPYIVDAAAAALYAECRLNLERIPA